jgi:mannose-6-phosphate isomerase-like protein (cupin superfamily)
MKVALLAMLPLVLSAPAAAAQTPRAAAPGASTTATITVTDLSGAPLSEVEVTLTGSIDRSGSTATNGSVKFDGLRPGTYRLRFQKEGYVLFERELDVRAKQPAPNPSIALSPAPAPPAPAPPEPSEPSPPALPPPGKAITVNVPDFIEQNFIASTEPQKVSEVGCSGLAHTMLWQVREPWDNRAHDTADAMLYVVGGEGTVRLGTSDLAVRAGSFVQIPRATTYSVTRRGRNPIILLATLVGEPCP